MHGRAGVARFETIFVELNKALVALVLLVIFAIVFANVVGRYGFGNSLSWVEEAARHLMIFGAFCGAGLALRQGRLVAITLLPDLLPPPLARAARWSVVLAMFVFMAAMAWLGVEFVRFGWPKETMSTGISRGIPYLSIPIGCGLFLVHLALFARRFVAQDFEDQDAPADGTSA